jgi:adenylosuccinate lyase
MPTKVNPILFENAEGCFTIAYNTFQTALEANCDSRGLRDLSNSIINRQVLDGWAFLYLGLKGLVRGMEQADYNIDACYQELLDNPECLGELLRYYVTEVEGSKDPYFEIKNNPPRDFEETLKRMSIWKFKW